MSKNNNHNMSNVPSAKQYQAYCFVKLSIRQFLVVFVAILLIGCGGSDGIAQNDNSSRTFPASTQNAPQVVKADFVETFEGVYKKAYAGGMVATPQGNWHLEDALAVSDNDKDGKFGETSVRIRNNGYARMEFDLPNGASAVRVFHSVYPSRDRQSKWQLNASMDGGKTWQQIGEPVESNVYGLLAVDFELAVEGKIRFEIRKISGEKNRINIDDFMVFAHGVAAPPPDVAKPDPIPGRSPEADMPAPSGAARNMHLSAGLPMDDDPSDDLLIERDQYVISYNPKRNIANWASWHLKASHYGVISRSKEYFPDPELGQLDFAPTSYDYSGSGYQRGHLVRSRERTATITDNRATFYMTNITPQVGELNMGPWLEFENWCKHQSMGNSKELYIIAGSVFEKGKTPKTIGRGIAVPDAYFKIALVLKRGQTINDVNEKTILAAVIMPNTADISDEWWHFITSVDEIEAATGYDFLNVLPDDVEKVLEAETYGK